MASVRPHYQVVFLIDVVPSNGDDLKSALTKQARQTTICLTVFRVLTNLLTKIRDKSEKEDRPLNKACQKLKWGCKFFNSKEHKGKIERSQFKSFKLKHFEVFEKEVEKRLEESNKIDERDDIVDSKRRRSSLGYKTKNSSPADNVGKVLSEVFADFQWEAPDLMSPGRPSRRKNKPVRWGKPSLNSSQDRTSTMTACTRNLLFVLSSCPNNEEKLKYFCGRKCIDGDVFLDSVLTTAMIDKLRGSLRLDLFWIDTGGRLVSTDSMVDENSVAKVIAALGKVSGKLVPLDAILQGQSELTLSCFDRRFASTYCSSSSINFASTPQKTNRQLAQSEANMSCILPTSCSLEHYLHYFRNCDKRRSVEKVQICEENKAAGQLSFRNGSEEEILCKLILQSAVKSQPSSSTKMASVMCDAVEGTLGSVDTTKAGYTADDLMKSCKFCVIGAVHLQADLVHSLSMGQSFVCCGEAVDEHRDTENKSKFAFRTRSQAFQNLISELMSQQKILVVSIQATELNMAGFRPSLAVLHPLTVHSGILTVLSDAETLKLEKHVLVSVEKEQEETHVTKSFDEWRDKVISSQLKPTAKSEGRSHISEISERQIEPFSGGVLEKWHPSGPNVRLASLVHKLSSRVESFSFLDPEEKALLKQVQKLYRRENQPMLHSQYEENRVKLEQERQEQNKQQEADDIDEVDGNVGNIVALERLRSFSKIASGGRSEKMVKSGIQKSKTKSTTLPEEDEDEKNNKKERLRPDISAADFRDETELVKYLQEVYSKTVCEEESADTCVQTIVLVALHFLKQSGAGNPEESLKQLMEGKILLDNARLRQKHNCPDCSLNDDQKLLEYKLQIQLQFEIAATQTDVDTMTEDCIEEVCNMLRKWSISGKLNIRRYLEEVLVEHYIHTLPKSLGSLYDTLMLPLPEELAKVVPRGDHSSLDDSCFSDTLMSPTSSLGPGSVTSRSNPPSLNQQALSDRSDILTSANFKSQKSRKLVVHPSLSDIGPKRQIMVAVNPAATRKRTKSKQAKGRGSAKKGSARKGSARKGSARKGSARKGSAKKGSARKKKKESEDTDVKAVRRNLFMSESKLERRQSVAVMENLRSSKRSQDRRNVLCSPCRSPRVKNNTPNLVAETPAYKQKIVLRRRESMRERRIESAPVVMESPLKTDICANTSLISEKEKSFGKSPVKSQINVVSAKRSFYTAGPQSRSRNLDRYRQLANRIAGRDPNSGNQLKSPDRLFVVKQLKGSPSPSYSLRCTPKKPDTTPVKGVMDSPSQNTRSRTPSRAAVNLVLYRDSPKVSGWTPKQSVTRKLALSLTPEKPSDQFPIPFQQATAGFVPGTPTRTGPHRDICFDSPSRNTRSQIKPSSGIRNLSFDQEPSANFSHSSEVESTAVEKLPLSPHEKSPQRGNRNLMLSVGESPQESVVPCTPKRLTTPNSAAVSPACKRNTPPTPASILKKRRDCLSSPQRPVMKVRWREEDMESLQDQNKCCENNKSSVPNTDIAVINCSPKQSDVKHSPTVIKTPTRSPRKPKVRTPDFDTWPRRKPRFSLNTSPKCSSGLTSPTSGQTSPCEGKSESITPSTTPGQQEGTVISKRRAWRQNPDINKQQAKGGLSGKKPVVIKRNINLETAVKLSSISSVSRKDVSNENVARLPGTQDTDSCNKESNITYNLSAVRSVCLGKRRRSQEDIDSEVHINGKRQKCADGKTIFQSQDRTQINSDSESKPHSVNNSEKSAGGSSHRTDYFASTNEEVFLTEDVVSSPLSSPSETSSVTSPISFPAQKSPKFTRLHSLKRFSKVLSSGSESGMELVENHSPVFVPSAKTVVKEGRSEPSSQQNQYGCSDDSSPGNKTLNKSKLSPSLKSYSPNVSAKGLLSLMNSPLVKSGPSKRSLPSAEDDIDTEVVQFAADHNRSNKRRKTVARSRRSLNLIK